MKNDGIGFQSTYKKMLISVPFQDVNEKVFVNTRHWVTVNYYWYKSKVFT